MKEAVKRHLAAFVAVFQLGLLCGALCTRPALGAGQKSPPQANEDRMPQNLWHQARSALAARRWIQAKAALKALKNHEGIDDIVTKKETPLFLGTLSLGLAEASLGLAKSHKGKGSDLHKREAKHAWQHLNDARQALDRADMEAGSLAADKRAPLEVATARWALLCGRFMQDAQKNDRALDYFTQVFLPSSSHQNTNEGARNPISLHAFLKKSKPSQNASLRILRADALLDMHAIYLGEGAQDQAAELMLMGYNRMYRTSLTPTTSTRLKFLDEVLGLSKTYPKYSQSLARYIVRASQEANTTSPTNKVNSLDSTSGAEGLGTRAALDQILYVHRLGKLATLGDDMESARRMLSDVCTSQNSEQAALPGPQAHYEELRRFRVLTRIDACLTMVAIENNSTAQGGRAWWWLTQAQALRSGVKDADNTPKGKSSKKDARALAGIDQRLLTSRIQVWAKSERHAQLTQWIDALPTKRRQRLSAWDGYSVALAFYHMRDAARAKAFLQRARDAASDSPELNAAMRELDRRLQAFAIH